MPTFLAVMLPPEVEQTEDQDGGKGTEAVRHYEIHGRPPSGTRQDWIRHAGCAGLRAWWTSGEAPHAGWTSFLTDACQQLQFAWGIVLLRAERTNPSHTQMWQAKPMSPQMDNPKLESSTARLRTRRKLCDTACGHARDEISQSRPHGLEPSSPELQHPCRLLRGHARYLRASTRTKS